MATSPNSPVNSNSPRVQAGNVFVYDGSGTSAVPDTGSFGVNAIIHRDATPRARVGTTSIPDAPSAAIAGSAEASARLPTLSNLRALGAVGAAINTGNDVLAVGQHVWQGNGAEAVTETAGVLGQAGVAWAGVQGGTIAFGTVFPPSAPVGGLIGGIAGAYDGSESLSGILCTRHSMTTRSMYATQDQDRCGGTPSGDAADSG